MTDTGRAFLIALNRNLLDSTALAGAMPANLRSAAGLTGGALSDFLTANLTASRALESGVGGKLAASAVTATELGYVSGVTSAIQTQIDTKAPLASPTFTGTVAGVTKAMVGLGNADNTSDAAKPISTATQTALDLKLTTTSLDATLDAKPDATTAVESNLSVTAAGAVVKTYPTGRASILFPGVHFSLPAGYGAGTAAAINAAMAAASANGGGEVYLPPEAITLDATIDNKYSRVLLKSAGGMRMVHGVAAAYGCKIVPTFAGTVLRHRTPRAAETGGVAGPRNDGGGFQNMSVVGNGIAKKLLEVDSIQWGIYHLFLEDCDGDTALAVNRRFAAEFLCGVTGVDLSEATNIQKMSCHLVVRQLSATGNARDCGGVLLSGASNSNVCFNDDIDLDIQHYNGTALQGDSADNNKLTFRAYRPAGTGVSFYGEGRKGSVVGFEGNWFERYSTNVAGYLEGTADTDVTAGVINNIERFDNLNGTVVPTAGTGSFWSRIDWNALMVNFAAYPGFVISDNTATALTEQKALGTKGLVIANGSEGHITLQNNSAAAKWLFRVITASGNLQFLRQAGAGYFDLGGVDAKMNALRITDGITAPSAVTGQAQIYVDTADGDLKIIFADGIIKTIVLDT